MLHFIYRYIRVLRERELRSWGSCKGGAKHTHVPFLQGEGLPEGGTCPLWWQPRGLVTAEPLGACFRV